LNKIKKIKEAQTQGLTESDTDVTKCSIYISMFTKQSAVAERPRVLRVTEYFAKSHNITRNDTLE